MRTLLAPPPLAPGEILITDEEAHHGRAVLRLKTGDTVRLADGDGRAATAQVLAVDRHALRLKAGEIELLAKCPASLLTVAVAPPKGDRFADLVRGLTELGVGAIRPLACAHGERLPDLERCRRVAAEALKQCRRSHLPRIGPLLEFPTLEGIGERVILLDQGGAPARPGLPEATILVIGPEGGLTTDEQDRLHRAGAVATRLAGPILRIETAALAAAAVWTAAWEALQP